MSGPKTARYTLTPEQRQRILEEQKRILEQQRLQRKIREAEEMNASLYSQAKAELWSFQNNMAGLEELSEESGRGKAELQQFRIFYEETFSQVQQLEKANTERNLEYLEIQKAKLFTVIGAIQKEKEQYKKTLSMLGEQFQDELAEDINNGFQLSFYGLGANRKQKENPCILKIQKALEEVSKRNWSSELETRFKELQQKASEIKSADFLENFYSLSVLPFVRNCQEYARYGAEYEELLTRYEILTEELGEVKKSYCFSIENLQDLKEEIEVLEQSLLERREQAYISEVFDEAMREMGYELVGDRTVEKKSGKKFHNGLYLFEQGTAVNIIYADNGQITMELGGIDDIDRIPTAEESSRLTEDMHAFCSDYAEIEKILAKQGVVAKRISMLPPSAEYAQIFNVSDYNMTQPVEKYEIAGRKKKMSGSSCGKEVYRNE